MSPAEVGKRVVNRSHRINASEVHFVKFCEAHKMKIFSEVDFVQINMQVQSMARGFDLLLRRSVHDGGGEGLPSFQESQLGTSCGSSLAPWVAACYRYM